MVPISCYFIRLQRKCCGVFSIFVRLLWIWSLRLQNRLKLPVIKNIYQPLDVLIVDATAAICLRVIGVWSFSQITWICHDCFRGHRSKRRREQPMWSEQKTTRQRGLPLWFVTLDLPPLNLVCKLFLYYILPNTWYCNQRNFPPSSERNHDLDFLLLTQGYLLLRRQVSHIRGFEEFRRTMQVILTIGQNQSVFKTLLSCSQ